MALGYPEFLTQNAYPSRTSLIDARNGFNELIIVCCLLGLDERIGVRPVGIGETFCQSLAKLVMRAAGDQAIAACGKLQMCAVLKADIEGSTHAVWQHRIDRVRAIRGKEVEDSGSFNEE